MPSAIPETTGSPAAVRPRPSARETSSPYGVARRAPTIATRLTRRDCGERPGDMEHRGRVGQLAQAFGIRAIATAHGGQAGVRDPAPGGGRIEVLVATGRGRVEPEQALVGQREHARGAAALLPPRDVDRPRDRGDQVGAAEAGVTRDRRHAAHPLARPAPVGRDAPDAGRRTASGPSHAAAGWGAASVRCASAAATCSGPTTSEPSRSAAVRATRRTRWWPRALRPSRSWSS